MNVDLMTDFCRRLVDQMPPSARLGPVTTARSFVEFFSLVGIPKLEGLTRILEMAGVGVAVATRLPGSYRGFHAVHANTQYVIQYEASEWSGAQEHTVLHETYEIVIETLRDLYPVPGYPRGKRLCRDADRFAASVLMQPDLFAVMAETTGFDVVALQRLYRRSYSSVSLRLVEVMRHQPLLAVLYERVEKTNPSEWADPDEPAGFKASVVARTPGFRIRTQRRPLSYLRGLLPRRGTPPAPGSVAESVVRSGRPVHVERVSGYDLWKSDDLAVAARPVLWGGRVAKVALVAVPYRDRSVLRPQLDRDAFHRIPEAHQVI